MELKTKTFVFIVLSFLLGGVAGGFIGRTYFGSPPGGRRPPNRVEMQKQFTDRLKLTTVQSTKVDSILESFKDNFSQVQSQYWQSFHVKRDTLRMSIRALLTIDQNKLFDEYIREMDQREARHRDTTAR
ncbi:MAG: hypothetical protein NTU47_15905 [Ignavibacteriales bacterium]|nr:hypothetical protein [Ignavibacteriales bacterium]